MYLSPLRLRATGAATSTSGPARVATSPTTGLTDPYKRVEWWRKGKQVIDRDEILALVAGETEEARNAVAQFLDERAVTEIRIIGDTVELDGDPVARLAPNLRLSQRDRLVELFDAVDEDAETIAELEARIAQLEERLKAPAR
jgi:hypothetical protein